MKNIPFTKPSVKRKTERVKNYIRKEYSRKREKNKKEKGVARKKII